MDKKPASGQRSGYVETAPGWRRCEFDRVRTNGESGRTVARYDTALSLGVAIPVLVAERAGVDPLSLPPLYDRIDVDALDAVIGGERTGAETRVRFEYAGYAVTVGGGRLAVRPAE
ncbi:HalOD1 output domain-containing protein [Haloarcula onubensis]|uniref:Halobacterial output domain-containing protein n=1 Tax=Haloarcula onubensis TaxID=2950539 RepID=A0ABU2FLL4_9EURY|nr:HalOD1 output domain-containing protein [Halomicroarcula sp. S3CR25-11]MDS0281177.1 hypothetical protein [Halomicroarcula sp. S3CR25-11]